MSQFRRAFASKLVEHEGTQAQNWAISTKRNEMGVGLESIRYGIDVKGNFANLLEAQKWIDTKLGLDWSDPNVRKMSRSRVQAAVAPQVESAVKGFLASNDPYRAEVVLQEAFQAGAIDGNANTRIAGTIAEYVSTKNIQVSGDNVASSFVMDTLASTQVYEALPAEKRREWSDYFTEDGMQKPDADYSNPFGLKSYGQSAMNNAIAKFGTVESAQYALSFDSPQRLEAALKAIGHDNPTQTEWEAQMSDEEKARHTRMAKAYRTSVRAGNKTPTDNEILSRVKTLYPELSEEERYKAAQRAKEQIDVKTARESAERDSTMWQINQALDAGGPIDMTQFNLTNFTGEERSALDELVAKRVKGADYGDDVLYGQLMDDPAGLAAMTDTQFLLLQRRLSRDQFVQVSSRREALRTKGLPKDKVEFEKIDNAFRSLDVLRGNDMKWLSGTDEASKRRKNMFRQLMYDEMRRFILQNGTKDYVPSQEDYNKVVLSTISRIQATDPGWFFRDEYLSAGQLEGKNIPNKLRLMVARTTGRNESNMSDEEVIYGLLKMDLNPFSPMPRNAISETDRLAIEELYAKATGSTQPPSDAIVRQLFIAQQLGLPNRIRLLTGQPVGVQPVSGTRTAERAQANPWGVAYEPSGAFADR